MLIFSKNVFYDTVFQRMKGNHADPSPVVEKIDHIVQVLLQDLQFPVQLDADRLVGSLGGMSSCRLRLLRDRPPNNLV